MTKTIKLRKGFDIKIRGEAQKVLSGELTPQIYGIKPVDFPGLIPKMAVKPGDSVKAGSPLFTDKLKGNIVFASPVSGKVLSVDRGERRKILEVVVERGGDEYVDFGKTDPTTLKREQIIDKLLASGLWPAMRQRPYHIVANPMDIPKSIFISAFDSSPLAPDLDFIIENSSFSLFQKGLDVLKLLTPGKVNLVLDGRKTGNSPFTAAKGVDISYFSGPHPSGNIGVHIHHLDPINKGEAVWFIGVQEVIGVGRLFEEGIYKPEKIVALTGSEVISTGYFKTRAGASIKPVVESNTTSDNVRFISGNVLTGTKIGIDGFLGYYDQHITVIPEGNYYEMFGWAMPGFNKYTFSRAFLSFLTPKKEFRLDTNFHGEERAFVVTGQYEKVVPMDIYPMQLFKAILAQEVELMEQLGIYEVAEEDFALCEFLCTSKIEIQSIVRDGLDLMMKEMN